MIIWPELKQSFRYLIFSNIAAVHELHIVFLINLNHSTEEGNDQLEIDFILFEISYTPHVLLPVQLHCEISVQVVADLHLELLFELRT